MTIEQERIKKRRKELKLTQKEVADRLGISQQAYQQLESGRTTDMRTSTLRRLCVILKASADYMLGLTDDPAEASGYI